MTLDEMKRIKKERGYTYAQIAEMSGVPLGTVQKIFCGETQAPRYDTLQALEAVFLREAVKTSRMDGVKAPAVQEAALYESAGRPGEYTAADYYGLPEEQRAELIDGCLYDMSSPSFVHQRIVGEVYRQIAVFTAANKGGCIPVTAPVDVRLDCDNRTIVQPDVLIVCDRGKIKRWGILGAPDFILEILSPSTKRKDCIKKLDKYMEAGVREYWMIDPDRLKLIVYRFEEEVYPEVYGLQGRVPLGIYQKKLFIDLDMVRDMIVEYPEDGREDVW